ncbi:hypothetical protein MTYM_02004 [Methylococcales bacterium]|nr:hypothetical protein MTYM_02004 [Methylococcales bacterium]
MFDTPDLLTPTMQCAIVIFVGLGLVFLSGLIPALWVIRTFAREPLRQKLGLSVAAMSIGALGIVFLCVLIAQKSINNQWIVSHGLEGSVCVETPIAAQFKMSLTQLRDGTNHLDIRDVNSETRIFNIERYVLVGNYVAGRSEHNYFWFDLRTGAYRYEDNQNDFVESLKLIGVSQPIELLPADTLCNTQDCKPCVR